MNQNIWTIKDRLPTDTFLHAVNPKNWQAIWNLSLSPYLASTDWTSNHDAGLRKQYISYRNYPLQDIKNGKLPPSILAPRMRTHLAVAAIDRAGLVAQIGSVTLKPDEQDRLRRMDDMEMKFAFIRREFASDAATRYGCLWLAENSAEGRAHLTAMLPGAAIMQVKITDYYRLTRCDSQFIDAYSADQNIMHAKHYWQGKQFNIKWGTWEFLLDGQIQFYISDVDSLCLTAMSLATWPKGLPVPERVIAAAKRAL